MKGTLIKRAEGDYKLFVNDTPLGQSKESPYNKLSIKNCQAIEKGYDLDELSESHAEEMYSRNENDYNELANFENRKRNFEEGFQKAMELMEGKKYSEEDMREAYNNGMGNIDNDGCRIDNADIDFKDTIDYMQKYEWEVEIEMGTLCRQINCVDNATLVKSKIVWDKEDPILDKDGCLILKRI